MLQIPSWLRQALEPLPCPVRFSDGVIRLSTVRIALLRRVWAHFPQTAQESGQALHAYAGGDVLDIGAFHGWYSVLLAPLASAGDRFVSFEPDSAAIPALKGVIGDLGRVFPVIDFEVVTEPVGDGSSVAASHPAGIVGHPRFGAAAESQEGAVPSLTVDGYVDANDLRPGLIKIDVEGAELSVLQGMTETLAKCRPTVVLEIHPRWQPHGVDVTEVEALVREAGYTGVTFDDSLDSCRQVWTPRVAAVTPA